MMDIPYLVKNTYNNLFRLFSTPYGVRRPHRIRLLGGGSRPIERGRDSLAHHRGARTEKRPVCYPTVPVSVRWYPRPGCYPALIKIPHRSFRHVVATG